jgi:chromosome partitioning protein
MAKTISFHLQKGGVGKTTISGTLACQSALDGYRTLLIDVDPQGNASSWFLKEAPHFELADVVQGKCYIQDAIIPIPQIQNMSLLPTFGIGGTLKLYAETKLAEEPFVLQDLVHEVSESFDRIILDLSPGLGRLERAALISSNEVITPMTPEVFSLIINSFDNRIKQHRDIYNAACKGVFTVYKIPVDPLFRKAQEAGYAPQLFKSRGRGLKESTVGAIKTLNKDIWR